MGQKRDWLRKHADRVRRGTVLEPRGHVDMVAAMLTEAVSPEAHAGILFHAPENVIREFPQFPAVHTYEDLKREFIKASSRQLSL